MSEMDSLTCIHCLVNFHENVDFTRHRLHEWTWKLQCHELKLFYSMKKVQTMLWHLIRQKVPHHLVFTSRVGRHKYLLSKLLKFLFCKALQCNLRQKKKFSILFVIYLCLRMSFGSRANLPMCHLPILCSGGHTGDKISISCDFFQNNNYLCQLILKVNTEPNNFTSVILTFSTWHICNFAIVLLLSNYCQCYFYCPITDIVIFTVQSRTWLFLLSNQGQGYFYCPITDMVIFTIYSLKSAILWSVT